MNNEKQESKLWTGQFVILLLIGLIFFVGIQVLTAGFPAYITDIKNNPAQGGLMTTVFMVAAILVRPIFGFILPKVNAKKLNVITLAVLAVLIALGLNQTSVGILLVLRALHGICFGILTTSFATIATNSMPASRMGEGVGFYGTATSSGSSFAPMLAISILQGISYNFLIIFSVILIVVTIVLTLMLKNKPKEAVAKQPVNMPETRDISFKEYVFDKNALLPSSLVFFFSMTLGGVTSFLEPLGNEVNLAGTISLFFLVQGIFVILSKVSGGYVYDRFEHKSILYFSALCGIIGLYLLSTLDSTPKLLLAGVFYGIAFGMVTLVLQTLTVSSVSKKKQGTANAMYLTFMDLGMALGSYFLGVLASHMGYRFIYGFSIIFLVLLTVIYRFTYGRTSKVTQEAY